MRLVPLASANYDFSTAISTMTPAQLRSELFKQLSEPCIGEALFDCLTDLVFFVKNWRGEYVVVNRTLVERCGRSQKSDLIGRRADEVFPPPLGDSYREQDESVLRSGIPIQGRLELHCYPAGVRGWCLTNKLALRGKTDKVVGVIGISKDLHPITERSEDYSRVAEVLRHIHTCLDQPLRVRDLAERAGLSVYQFEQRIRRLFQITPGQLIQKVRMDTAEKRLREGDEPIANVALDCGYSDQSAFTRQFRQTIGLSPSQYRRGFRLPGR